MKKHESIDKALILWEYIRDNDIKIKGIAYVRLELTTDMAFCPFCEYDSYFGNDCGNCPALSEWGEAAEESPENVDSPPCLMQGSPFKAWDKAQEREDRTFWANEMVKLVKRVKDGQTTSD